jgi:hypothetical protein
MPEAAKSDTARNERAAICTLFEGDYHLGLAAFLNSLVHAEYSGIVWAGYRGNLPPWVKQLRKRGTCESSYLVGGNIELTFLPLEAEIHLTNYKPQFMLDLFEDGAGGCDYLWYFDPDIFVRVRWTFFANWQRHGIALCEEIVNNNLPANSPLRREWEEIASTIGLSNARRLDRYYNGGLVGVASAHKGFLDMWRQLIVRAGQSGCDLNTMMPGDREMPFHASDQDALNIAAMFTKFPLSTLGPQGMGFLPGDVKMYHTVGQKPWRGSFVLRALAGNPPSNAMKFFLTRVAFPIRAYSAMKLCQRRLSCAIAAFIGRFYCRR